MSRPSLFASKSLTMHLFRGAIGIGALGYAMFGREESLLVWATAIVLSIVAFRGCPTCWTLGLIETAMAKLEGRAARGCVDGACATPSSRTPRL